MGAPEQLLQPAIDLQLCDALSERVDPPGQVVIDRV